MPDCAILPPLSRSLQSPKKTLYLYELIPRTRELAFSRSLLNARSRSKSLIPDISGRIRSSEQQKEVNWNRGLNSRRFGNEMLGKIDSRDFTSSWFGGNAEKNGGERYLYIHRNSGLSGRENYSDRCRWNARSFGNDMRAKISHKDYSGPLDFGSSGSSEKIRGERDKLESKRPRKNWNPRNREILNDNFEFEERRSTREVEDAAEEKILGRKSAGFGRGEKEKIPTFDLLELKRDLEKTEEIMSSSTEEDSDLVPPGGSQRSGMESKGGELVGISGLRRKDVLRRSAMLAKQVISMESALSLGFVSQLWVDTRSWVVVLVEVRPSLLSGEMERFLLEDICQVGDVVLVQDESVIENEVKMIGLDTLVGYNVVTPSRQNVGKVRGYTFNINSGAVELLELDSFGISIIPASLVSTYGLPVDDVLGVTSDTVVVHEDAASHVQRLSKGFWDTRNVESYGDELRRYSNLGNRSFRSVRHQRTSNNSVGKKSTRRMRDTDVDWELPMDY
ncbi:PRC-barrel-like protein [Cinnamomum micranthum f. kanehirae]|uniref:PRC-barrel-like protein n=1 Tax=Cinnamomum micranthum f. kanehirae TaxID=337451 RepID=A0A443NPS4_9MAGN|nr:PRC-barrel-like protein [Cinnamomum micranthum f. kanehirae]